MNPEEIALQFLRGARDLGLRSVSYSRGDVRIEAEFLEPAAPPPPLPPELPPLTAAEQAEHDLELDLASSGARR